MNENNVDTNEDLDDEESSSMPGNDKYRIHMDGDNIYVIYASPSQSSSSSDISVNSKIDTSVPNSPIVPNHKMH